VPCYPLVSVLVPLFQLRPVRGRGVTKNAVFLSRKYPNFRLDALFDDGSTDDSVAE